MIQRALRNVLGPALFLAVCSLPMRAIAQTELPSTEQFQSLLTTCAAGARIEIDGELRGSFASVYEGAQTEASGFRLITLTDFLTVLPEQDRLAGLRLYNECVLKILRGDLSEEDTIPEVVELPAQILTNGEPLTIRAVTLIANDTEIRAFPAGSRAANGNAGSNGDNGSNGANGSGGAGGNGDPGGAGNAGGNGQNAGLITIEAGMLIGNIEIFNNGVAGGNGGPGGVGGSGGAGGQGTSSASGLFDCRRGPGNGGAGGNAGVGGDGGRGGNGGDGGTVSVRFDTVADGSSLTITSQGGAAGRPGNPGQPGAPGRGGPRGNSGGNCGGGGRVSGSDGVPAGAGRSLGAGQEGADGQIEVIVDGETSLVTGNYADQF